MWNFKWDEEGNFLGDESDGISTLLNDVLGPRPVVLVGTKSAREVDNVAVFNTFQPLGARPPLFSLLIRPLDRQRDTYENMKTTKEWTVNFIRPEWLNKAHATGQHFPPETSEFQQVDLKKEQKGGISPPFVSLAPIQMWFTWGREVNIPENGTRLIVGHLQQLWLTDQLIQNGKFDFSTRECVSSWGLDHYATPGKVYKVES